MSKFLSIILGLFFISPFICLLWFAAGAQLPANEETLSILAWTFSQAFVSAAVSLVLGVAGAGAISYLLDHAGERAARVGEWVALLPNFVPVLVLLLPVYKFFPFARGWSGVVFVHALLNAGLASVAIARVMRDRLGSLAELAWIEGASRSRFFFKGALPAMSSDLRTIFLSIFALCFASFAIPLSIGGSQATTIEVLIWQKIRIDANWAQALGLAILELIAIICLSLLLRRRESYETPSVARTTRIPLLAWKWGLPVITVPSLVVLCGLLDSPFESFRAMFALTPLIEALSHAIFASFLVGVGTGILVLLILLMIAYVDPRGRTREIFLGYIAPSSVLTGFAILIAWRTAGDVMFFKMIAGLTMIATPTLYRLRWDAVLQLLRGQRLTAQTLGAEQGLIFQKLVLPQVIGPGCFIAGLASLWAWGDFALSSVVTERPATIALLAQGLMESYRLPAATAVVWIVIIGGLITFGFFNGVGRVLGARS